MLEMVVMVVTPHLSTDRSWQAVEVGIDHTNYEAVLASILGCVQTTQLTVEHRAAKEDQLELVAQVHVERWVELLAL